MSPHQHGVYSTQQPRDISLEFGVLTTGLRDAYVLANIVWVNGSIRLFSWSDVW